LVDDSSKRFGMIFTKNPAKTPEDGLSFYHGMVMPCYQHVAPTGLLNFSSSFLLTA